jgi:hypothetical protein
MKTHGSERAQPRRAGSRTVPPDADALRRFQTLPGVGKSIAGDLWELGLRSPKDLAGRDPERMYEEYCALKGQHVDRCLLYVFRCAVHFAETGEKDPLKRRWWYWKDR